METDKNQFENDNKTQYESDNKTQCESHNSTQHEDDNSEPPKYNNYDGVFDSIGDLISAIDEENISTCTSLNNNTYKFEEVIFKEGGEGAIYKASSSSGMYAVKIFFDGKHTNVSRQMSIAEKTLTPGADKYILQIVDHGNISVKGNKLYFEVQPFCEKGTLIDYVEHFNGNAEAVRTFTSQMSDIFNYIHNTLGIIHLDVKPENIFVFRNNDNDNYSYRLGDFGVSRIAVDGIHVTNRTHRTKIVPGTTGYQPPEAALTYDVAKITPAFDYYALGATIAYLYKGRSPFATDTVDETEFNPRSFDLDNTKLLQYINDSHIDIGHADVRETVFIQNLVDGLYQYDSKRRFGYEDVKSWLDDHNYAPYRSEDEDNNYWKTPFKPTGFKIINEHDMYEWIIGNWDVAKRHLWRRDLDKHFSANNDAGMALELQTILDERYPNDSDMALFASCLKIYHEKDTLLFWKNHCWRSLNELAEDVLSDNSNATLGAEILKNKLISAWLTETGITVDDSTRRLVIELESYAIKYPEIAVYWFAYVLGDANSKYFKFNNIDHFGLNSLFDSFTSNPVSFYNSVLNITLSDTEERARMMGFICSGGATNVGTPDAVWTYIEESKSVHDVRKQAHLLLLMMEKIAVLLNDADLVSDIRQFYYSYGPYGYVSYWLNIINNDNVYYSNNNEGRSIINSCKEIKISINQSISDIGTAMAFVESGVLVKFKSSMQNNPILQECGIFANKPIMCKDLKGYFIYKIFDDCVVPLGYKEILNL